MNYAVIAYDGDCLLCSNSVKFILKHDTKEQFLFTTFSSDYAKAHALLGESVAVITKRHKTLTGHHAVRYIIERLPKVRWMRVLFVITPAFFQKAVYCLVANNRKKWFGSQTCLLPQQISNRFIS